jgi:solute carrier family 25 protein 14/30
MSLATDAPWKLFVFASISASTAELCTTPIDSLKTRLQLQRARGAFPSVAGTLSSVLRAEGVSALYAGAAPAVARQATYGSLRMGLYEIFRKRLRDDGFGAKVLSGCASGACSAFVTNPFDVVKVRLQVGTATDRNVFTALAALARAEGVRGLYRGVGPTTLRAAVVAAGEISCYDEIKTQIIAADVGARDAVTTHLAASVLAGFVASVFASPFDVVKSRLQATQRTAGSTADVLLATFREGPFALWRGVTADFMRRGPHCVISFFILEQLRARFSPPRA